MEDGSTKAGLPEWINAPHQLCHHLASLMIEDGASPKRYGTPGPAAVGLGEAGS